MGRRGGCSSGEGESVNLRCGGADRGVGDIEVEVAVIEVVAVVVVAVIVVVAVVLLAEIVTEGVER